MKHFESTFVQPLKYRTLNNTNTMKSTQDWTHVVLQRLIIVFLGLLTLGVALQSCTTQSHTSCAAYDKVEVPK